jgi:hypothetical protein
MFINTRNNLLITMGGGAANDDDTDISTIGGYQNMITVLCENGGAILDCVANLQNIGELTNRGATKKHISVIRKDIGKIKKMLSTLIINSQHEQMEKKEDLIHKSIERTRGDILYVQFEINNLDEQIDKLIDKRKEHKVYLYRLTCGDLKLDGHTERCNDRADIPNKIKKIDKYIEKYKSDRQLLVEKMTESKKRLEKFESSKRLEEKH